MADEQSTGGGSLAGGKERLGAEWRRAAAALRAAVAPLTVAGTWRPHRPWRRYVQAAALVAGAALISLPVRSFIDPTNLVMIFLAVAVISGIYLGRGPSLLAAILSVLVFDFFFVAPHLSLAVSDTQYILTFLGLFVVGLVTSNLVARVREEAEASRLRELETAALYGFSRDLAAVLGLDALVRVAVEHTSRTFDGAAAVLLPAGEDLLVRLADPGLLLSDSDLTAATRLFHEAERQGSAAPGRGDHGLYVTVLRTAAGAVGVLALRRPDGRGALSVAQQRLLAAFGTLAAVAIERGELAELARRSEVLEATERLQSAVLHSISHDLRTPLAAITGALSAIADDRVREADRRSLLATAGEETARLNRLVGNLLDMSRLEAGALKATPSPCEVEDLIGAALTELGERLGSRPVSVRVSPGIPAVSADFVLIDRALVNIIDNAVKYSAPEAPIAISAQPDGDTVIIEVADRGIGIPSADVPRVFDKFYRVQRPEAVVGTGLGLAISKGIVEAHGGRIWAAARLGGGTVVGIALPAAPVEDHTGRRDGE